MAVIGLNLRGPRNEIIAVGNGVQQGGHVIVEPGERIDWKNLTPNSGGRVFLVSFYDWTLGTKVPVWPFKGQTLPPGLQCQGPASVPWLRVPGSGVRTDVDVAPGTLLLKYDVHVEGVGGGNACAPDATITPLDPAIIIRTRSSGVNVAFGVTCAVLGAVAGALAVALLS